MREAAEELSQLELLRLQEIGRQLWPLMNGSDPDMKLQAMDRYLNLLEYQARSLGS